MGWAAAALLDVMTAATSLDFDLDFLVFGRPLVSVVSPLPWAIDFLVRGCAMKLNARQTASLQPIGGGARSNRAEALGDAVGVDCDEFGRGPCGSGKAVLCCKHLEDSFCIGRVTNLASRYGDVLLVANPESARESGFSLSGGALVDIRRG